MKYRVWWIPTKLGMETFGWEPKFISEHNNEEDAMMEAYMLDCDDPAPDKRDYAGYYLIKIKNPKAGKTDFM
jgi:hypothetical protein